MSAPNTELLLRVNGIQPAFGFDPQGIILAGGGETLEVPPEEDVPPGEGLPQMKLQFPDRNHPRRLAALQCGDQVVSRTHSSSTIALVALPF